MIGRSLEELLGALHSRVSQEQERTDAARESKATALARKLPLVHRTAPVSAPDRWRAILQSGRIRAGEPNTEREKRLGSTRTAYFFFGHPAWPSGLTAFILRPLKDVLARATFTPFDSGGLTKHMVPVDPDAPPLDEAKKEAWLAEYTGAGVDVQAFGGPFIATHLRDPEAYVSSPQVSRPDWDAFHGLRSVTDDRRSWTIEVQVHDDVRLDPPEERIEALVVAGKDVHLDVDDDLFGLCTQVETEHDVPSAVIHHILTRP